MSFKKLYSEAVQTDPGKKEGGYIKLEFIIDDGEINWKEIVLEKLPDIIKKVQDRGYSASDIGIIVRDSKEGALVLKTITNFFNRCTAEEKERYNFNVVSNDSLLLSNSPAINFITAVLSVVNDPGNMIGRALMLRFFLFSRGDEEAEKAPLISDMIIEASRQYFPEGYEVFLERLRQMPLFEATESIIKFFGLGEYSWNIAYLNTFQDYIVSFSENKNTDFQSFLDWWADSGIKKSVVLPGNQDAIRILTIHKSKGLEFKVVILPFLAWPLDHIPSKQPILWVKPVVAPFNELGIVPVKYSSGLTNTIFDECYKNEKYSVYLDNINLLYVSLTRAKDAIFGFSVYNPKSKSSIAGVLRDAITLDPGISDGSDFVLNRFFDAEKRLFEFGEIPLNTRESNLSTNLVSTNYNVSSAIESLKLKLHGENYFSSEAISVREKINYGKLMHEIFESIDTPEDIPFAVRKLVLEGKLPEEESSEIEKKVNSLIDGPLVREWFLSGNKAMTEAGILLPSGITRRPDRVIFKDGRAVIIDFKFGEENPHHAEQVEQYRHLLADMGYSNPEAFIWYVEKNKIVSV